MPAIVAKPVIYTSIRENILPGDVLLYRPMRWDEVGNRAIARRGPRNGLRIWQRYAHVGIADRHYSRQWIVEMVQGHPGRVRHLSAEVAAYPGQYDLYRPREPYSGKRVAAKACEFVGMPYGWRSLVYTASRRIPWIASLLPTPSDDIVAKDRRWPPHCAQMASIACRAGGRDPRPDSADIITEPSHFAMAAFADYQYTLCSTENQVLEFCREHPEWFAV